jgi:hypothetical protein
MTTSSQKGKTQNAGFVIPDELPKERHVKKIFFDIEINRELLQCKVE